MKRFETWDVDLQEFFLGRVNTPFTWSTNDCCSFASDSILAMTGVDVAAWFRGKMDPSEGRRRSFQLLKEFSGGSVKETWEKMAEDNDLEVIREEEIVPGDVVLMKVKPLDPVALLMADGVTLGVKSFKEGFFSPGKDGLVLSVDPEIVKAWRV